MADPPPPPVVEPSHYGEAVPVYIVVSLLSVLATSLVTLVSTSSRRLRGDHHSVMIQTITVCDLLFTLKFLIAAIAWAAGKQDARSSFHLFADNCMSAAAYGVFTGLASTSWNAAWVVDFLCVLINPLRNTAAQRRWYHLVVWSLCIFGTVWTLATSGHQTSDDHTCLVRGTDSASLIFEIPLLFYVALAVCSLVFAACRLSSGTRNTAVMRRRLLMRHSAYVAAFLVLWLWPLVRDFMGGDSAGGGPYGGSPVSPGAASAFAILDALSASGQAAVFACIRLSEPGAWAILTRLLRGYARDAWGSVGALVCPLPGCARWKAAVDAALAEPLPPTLGAKGTGGAPHNHHHHHHHAQRARRAQDAGSGGGVASAEGDDEERLLGFRNSLSSSSSAYSVAGGAAGEAGSGDGGGTPEDGALSRGSVRSVSGGRGAGDSHFGGMVNASLRKELLANQRQASGSNGSGVGAGRGDRASSNIALLGEDGGPQEEEAAEGARGSGVGGFFSSLRGALGGMGNASSSSASSHTGAGKLRGLGDDTSVLVKEPLLLSAQDVLIGANDDGGGGLRRPGASGASRSSGGGGYLAPESTSGTSVASSLPGSSPTSSRGGKPGGRGTHARTPDAGARRRSRSGSSSGSGSGSSSSESSSSDDDDDEGDEGLDADALRAREKRDEEAEAEKEKEQGWDLAAGLRTEMGTAMLSALCQAVAFADGILPLARGEQVPTGVSFAPPPFPSSSALPSSPGGHALSRNESTGSAASAASPTLSMSSSGTAISSSDVFVSASPVAPDEFRGISSWLRDASTASRTLPVAPPNALRQYAHHHHHHHHHHEHAAVLASPPSAAASSSSTGDRVEISSFHEASFRSLRRAAGVAPAEICAGFHPDLLKAGKLNAHFSDGASSSFFCRSPDGALIVKTVTSGEAEVLLRLLPAYTRHMTTNPDSLLLRVYGLFGVRLPSSSGGVVSGNFASLASAMGGMGGGGAAGGAGGGTGGGTGGSAGDLSPFRIFFVLMGNVLPVADPGTSALVFDLKGSTVNRRARISKSVPKEPKEKGLGVGGGAGAGGGDGGADASSGPGGSSSAGLDGSSSPAAFPPDGEPGGVNIPTGKGLLYQDIEFRESIPHGLPVVDADTMVAERTAHVPDAPDAATGSVAPAPPGMHPAVSSPYGAAAAVWNTNSAAVVPDIRLGVTRANALVDQLQRDVTLLASQGLMDYSLLLQMVPVKEGMDEDGDVWLEGDDEGEEGGEVGVSGGSGSAGAGAGAAAPVYTTDLSFHDARAIGPRKAAALLRALDAAAQPQPPLPADVGAGAAASSSSFFAGSPSGPSTTGAGGASSAHVSRFSPLAAHVCALGTPMPTQAQLVAYQEQVRAARNDPQALAALAQPPAPYARRVLVQVGLIDLFQFFGTGKKMEAAFKALRHGTLDPDVSAVEPHKYAVRFMAFAANVFTPLARGSA
jgi:hypothetical protein